MKKNISVTMIVIFISGLVIGFIGGQMHFHWRLLQIQKNGPQVLRTFLIKQFQDQLDLLPEQLPAVEQAVQRGTEDLDRYRKAHGAEVWARIKQIVSDVRPTLSPQQQLQLDQLQLEDILPGPGPCPPDAP